jgi:hypothetical protein
MAPRQKVEGFGFNPAESEHYFLVTISAAREEPVYISEHFTWDDSEVRRQLSFALGREDSKIRVVLPRYQWEAIADAVRAEFNQRLKKNGLKMRKWKSGQTPLSRLFGKELVLLAWAIEDADPALIPVATKNWLGLAPEERWWLFTMTKNPVSDYQPQRPDMELFEVMEAEAPWASPAASVRRIPSPHSRSSSEKAETGER